MHCKFLGSNYTKLGGTYGRLKVNNVPVTLIQHIIFVYNNIIKKLFNVRNYNSKKKL